VTSEHGLFVQHAVRSSQMDAQLVNAMVNSQNSAAPGFGSLMDPFALGAPKVAQVAQTVAEAQAEEVVEKKAAAESHDKPVARDVTEEKATEAPQPEREVVKKPAVGLRAQLERFSKDHKHGARPITRATTAKI
jgi:large repetitive protein